MALDQVDIIDSDKRRGKFTPKPFAIDVSDNRIRMAVRMNLESQFPSPGRGVCYNSEMMRRTEAIGLATSLHSQTTFTLQPALRNL